MKTDNQQSSNYTEVESFCLLRNKVVLNVDDNEFNQLVVNKILDSVGIKTIAAENGLVAINRLKEGLWPDAILMDLQMPVMNGLDASYIIKKQINPTLPIIINSGSIEGREKWRLSRLGIRDYLEKPYSRHDILTKLSKIILCMQGLKA